jgi:hypothetical protein
MKLVNYKPLVDLRDFRLTAEPTLNAVICDIKKFYAAAVKGTDMVLLGRFLLGVSLIKAKKFVGNASRGDTAKRESGWMFWKKKTFPDCSNHELTDAVNFTKEIFSAWGDCKFSKMENLQTNDVLAFQLPENPVELQQLLTAIHNTMDGKKMTAFCRSIGRIVEKPLGAPKGSPGNTKKHRADADEITRRAIFDEERTWMENATEKILDWIEHGRFVEHLGSGHLKKFDTAMEHARGHIKHL